MQGYKSKFRTLVDKNLDKDSSFLKGLWVSKYELLEMCGAKRKRTGSHSMFLDATNLNELSNTETFYKWLDESNFKILTQGSTSDNDTFLKDAMRWLVLSSLGDTPDPEAMFLQTHDPGSLNWGNIEFYRVGPQTLKALGSLSNRRIKLGDAVYETSDGGNSWQAKTIGDEDLDGETIVQKIKEMSE